MDRLALSKRYKALPYSTLCDVVLQEWGRHKKQSETIAHCRRRLHKIHADYLFQIDFDEAKAGLTRVFREGDDQTIEHELRRILGTHASTRERLPDMGEFFQAIFDVSGIPRSLADLACAAGPLAFRWMGLPKVTEYVALDIDARFLDLVSHYFRLEGVNAQTLCCDVVVDPIEGEVDLCLLSKMYHCLEIRQRGAGWKAVERAPGRWVAVSLPTRNLRGQLVDIVGNYRDRLKEKTEELEWGFTEVQAAGEMIFMIEKTSWRSSMSS